MISLCQPIPDPLQYSSMALWPPAIIPSVQRVRHSSPSKFRTDTHRPRVLADVSDRTFRIRRWMEFSNLNSTRMGEDVMTYSTLLEGTYTPTKAKPWQGIWVGDYSAHGCEFLLVLQRDTTPNTILSRRSSTDSGLPAGVAMVEPESEDASSSNPNHPVESDPGNTSSGRLEAIKLTGDLNVPRGECTWFADDISDGGLIRIAEDKTFKGARIVKSMGHVADRGFFNDRFISSQLIMISHDSMAQYWEVSTSIHGHQRIVHWLIDM